MGDWNNVNPSDFDALKLKVSRLLRNVDCLASKDEFGITTLSPPVDAPGPNDPDVLINITTGIIYYWDGNSWEVYTSGGGSTLPYYEVQMILSEPDPIGAPGIFNIQEVMYNTFPGTTWDLGGAGPDPGGDGIDITAGGSFHAIGSGITFTNNADNRAKLSIVVTPYLNGSGKMIVPFIYADGVETVSIVFFEPGTAINASNWNNESLPITIRWYY